MGNNIRIILSKIITFIKNNFIKIDSKYVSLIALNVTLLKSSLKKSISSLASKEVFEAFYLQQTN